VRSWDELPQHEQALLYRAVPEQALAYLGTLLGATVTCLCFRAAAWRLFIPPTKVVVVTVAVAEIVLKLKELGDK